MIYLVLILGFGFYLLKNFDSEAGTLKVFGQSLQVGERPEALPVNDPETSPEHP